MKVVWHYGESITDEEYEQLQSNLKVVLPDDFYQVVKEHNKGRPAPNVFKSSAGELVVDRLLDVKTSGSESIWAFRDIPKGSTRLVPFALDPFGNLFCFSVENGKAGAVWFYNQESSKSVHLADTFQEVLAGLQTE